MTILNIHPKQKTFGRHIGDVVFVRDYLAHCFTRVYDKWNDCIFLIAVCVCVCVCVREYDVNLMKSDIEPTPDNPRFQKLRVFYFIVRHY